MVHSLENVDSLPRFVSLLRMAHGPVNRDEVHCDIQMALEELEELEALVLEIMPASMDLAVPLDVELKTGDTWGDME